MFAVVTCVERPDELRKKTAENRAPLGRLAALPSIEDVREREARGVRARRRRAPSSGSGVRLAASSRSRVAFTFCRTAGVPSAGPWIVRFAFEIVGCSL